nr:hypothetical protein [Tanacetum cinerariifolium]
MKLKHLLDGEWFRHGLEMICVEIMTYQLGLACFAQANYIFVSELPHLLLLDGIGPKADIKKVTIPVVHDNHLVGNKSKSATIAVLERLLILLERNEKVPQ